MRKPRLRFSAGNYRLEKEDGTEIYIKLTSTQAVVMFKLFYPLGYSSIELIKEG